MNKSVFLKTLYGHLKKMSKAERDDTLADFEEYFECAARDGEDEVAICARLGDPKKIAKEYYAQKCIENANRDRSAKTMAKAFISSAGLGVINFLYVLFVVAVGYIVIALLYIADCAVGLAALAAFAWTLVFFATIGVLAGWFGIFAGLGLVFLSALGFIGLMQAARQFKKANMYFLNRISNGIKRGALDA